MIKAPESSNVPHRVHDSRGLNFSKLKTGIHFALASGLLALCGCALVKTQHGIPNFSQVAPGVWRGGQPNAEGWAYLHHLGVTHEVKLDTEAEGSDRLAATNEISVAKYPISYWQLVFGPTDATVRGAVQEMAADDQSGVFVHCLHGQDRTGLIVATYLIEIKGVPRDIARQDMLAHGFHRSLIGLNWYWHKGGP